MEDKRDLSTSLKDLKKETSIKIISDDEKSKLLGGKNNLNGDNGLKTGCGAQVPQ